MKIVVGLGNPGREYAGTRHNVGFDVVDELAVRLGWLGKPADFDRQARSRFDAMGIDGVMQTSTGSEKLLLLKPQTYMNDSGRSVLGAMQFFQAKPSDLLIVLDDLALPCGQIRLRGEGSSGGHNGLRDISRVFSGDDYARLRIGIDPTPPRVPGRDYVLQRFTDEQIARLKPALARAAGCALTWADKGLLAAMNQFNTKPEAPSPKPQAPSPKPQAPSPKPASPGPKSAPSSFSNTSIKP
jgi:peptidyl-tRNA hydrolase, PTH1 family